MCVVLDGTGLALELNRTITITSRISTKIVIAVMIHRQEIVEPGQRIHDRRCGSLKAKLPIRWLPKTRQRRRRPYEAGRRKRRHNKPEPEPHILSLLKAKDRSRHGMKHPGRPDFDQPAMTATPEKGLTPGERRPAQRAAQQGPLELLKPQFRPARNAPSREEFASRQHDLGTISNAILLANSGFPAAPLPAQCLLTHGRCDGPKAFWMNHAPSRRFGHKIRPIRCQRGHDGHDWTLDGSPDGSPTWRCAHARPR